MLCVYGCVGVNDNNLLLMTNDINCFSEFPFLKLQLVIIHLKIVIFINKTVVKRKRKCIKDILEGFHERKEK